MIEIPLAMLMFAGCLAHAAEMLPRTRYFKVGGLRFFRVGRLQASWCICRKAMR